MNQDGRPQMAPPPVVYSSLKGWREAIQRFYCPLDLDVADKDHFSGTIHSWPLARLELTLFATDGEVAQRRKPHIARDETEYFMLGLPRSGTASYSQFGRECVLRPGHFGLLHTASPYAFAHSERVSTVCLKIPAGALAARLADAHALCGTAIPIRPGLARLTAETLLSLTRNGGDLASGAASLLEANLLDMIGLVLGAEQKRSFVGGTSVRWAICRRAMAFIKEAADRPDLSPSKIAAGIGVSTRYLHRVFEHAEQSVATAILTVRLDKCRADLLDPGLMPLSVKEIAFRNGFKSASHFAHSFRLKFGLSPRDARSTETSRNRRSL